MNYQKNLMYHVEKKVSCLLSSFSKESTGCFSLLCNAVNL